MPIAGHVMMGRLAYDSKNSSDRRIAREALRAGFKKFWFQPGAGNEAIRKLLEKRTGVSLVMAAAS